MLSIYAKINILKFYAIKSNDIDVTPDKTNRFFLYFCCCYSRCLTTVNPNKKREVYRSSILMLFMRFERQ